MKYYINYGTGAGNEYVEGTLADAMHKADEETAYTERDIKIYLAEDWDKNGPDALHVATRHWWGVKYDSYSDNDNADDIINFGAFGYYGAWVVRVNEEPGAESEYECRYTWDVYTHDDY